VARMGEERKVCKVLDGKPERKRPLGRSMHRCDGIRMGLMEIGWRVWSGFSRLGIGSGGVLL
jgi:hypothetical protein